MNQILGENTEKRIRTIPYVGDLKTYKAFANTRTGWCFFQIVKINSLKEMIIYLRMNNFSRLKEKLIYWIQPSGYLGDFKRCGHHSIGVNVTYKRCLKLRKHGTVL